MGSCYHLQPEAVKERKRAGSPEKAAVRMGVWQGLWAPAEDAVRL